MSGASGFTETTNAKGRGLGHWAVLAEKVCSGGQNQISPVC
jgi:hypothetical protein